MPARLWSGGAGLAAAVPRGRPVVIYALRGRLRFQIAAAARISGAARGISGATSRIVRRHRRGRRRNRAGGGGSADSRSSIRIIWRRRGPCAPSWMRCSMSPVRDGPVMKLTVRGSAPRVRNRSQPSSYPATTWPRGQRRCAYRAGNSASSGCPRRKRASGCRSRDGGQARGHADGVAGFGTAATDLQ